MIKHYRNKALYKAKILKYKFKKRRSESYKCKYCGNIYNARVNPQCDCCGGWKSSKDCIEYLGFDYKKLKKDKLRIFDNRIWDGVKYVSFKTKEIYVTVFTDIKTGLRQEFIESSIIAKILNVDMV